MKSLWRWSGFILLLFIPLLITSCAPIPKPAAISPSVYYISPVVTYLKECPAYDCKVVGELYRADRVEKVEVKDHWWRVRLAGGTLTGWLQADLLSPTPITPEIFYVAANTLELRECPSPDCPFRKILLNGDRVQKIDANDQGWLRVLVEKDASIGWILASQVTDKAIKPNTKPPLEKEYYFAAAANVNLHSLPLLSSKVVKSLPLNEKVEKLAQHGKDWFKVRHPGSGAEGWAAAKDLKTSPVTQEPPKKKKRLKRKPSAPKPGVPLEPEAM